MYMCMSAKAKNECTDLFWKFASKTLDTNASSHVDPTFSLQDVKEFFTKTYSSTTCNFTQPEWLPSISEPQYSFDCDPIRLDEVICVIKRAKASLSPSPHDAVSYNILKKCPSLAQALLCLYNQCWESSVSPGIWKQASIKLIHKSNAQSNPSDPSNFCPIAFISFIGKIYTTIVKDRWLDFMKANRYYDTRIQKAFMPPVPGCVEHYTKLAAAFSEACIKHKSLCVCWLDLANVYGSAHHDLINFSLIMKYYHAPSKLTNIVTNFYTGLSASVNTSAGRTKAIPLQIGVYQGDPLSVTIFNTVMNTYLEGLKRFRQSGYRFSKSVQSLCVLQYADDTCLVSDGPAAGRAILSYTDHWLQ